jgi:hypothetical protein
MSTKPVNVPFQPEPMPNSMPRIALADDGF